MKSIIIILSFLAAAIFLANFVSADPQIQVSSMVNPSAVAPGTDGYVQLTLINTGTSSASSIQIIGVTPDPGIVVPPSGTVNLGALGNGLTTTTLVKFSVSGSTASGLYSIRFAIGVCSSSCNEIDPVAVVTVQSPSSLQVVSIQPSTLAAGQATTLNFNLMNEGTDAINNIVMMWSTPNNEILPLGLSNRQFIPSIAGGSSLIIPINVSAASSTSPGVYPITITLSYHDKSGTLQTVNSTIGIQIGGTTDFDVAVQQAAAGSVSLSIANIGVNPATSVAISIPQQDNFAVSGASSSFLGTLNPGDFSVATFALSSRAGRSANGNFSATSGNTLQVEISYSDTSGARQVLQKEVTVETASLLSGTAARNRGFGFIGIIEIVAVIVVVAIAVWYFEFRKKRHAISNFIRRRKKS